MNLPAQLYDMDQVLLEDGRICRVMGNFASDSHFLGFNIYSPAPDGDRLFRDKPYVKNYFEDKGFSHDALEIYELILKDKIVEFFEPITAAQTSQASYEGTIWHQLYRKLVDIFGANSVGILGSALSGLHLKSDGSINNDVDFFIEGLNHIDALKQRMPEVREALGFEDYSAASQQSIQTSSAKVFRNPYNTIAKIHARRWSGMELPGTPPVLNTIRFRDKKVISPLELLDDRQIVKTNVVVRGTVSGAAQANLYPRIFQLGSEHTIYCMWWKFSSPVNDGDVVEVCGDLMRINDKYTVRISNFADHWINIIN